SHRNARIAKDTARFFSAVRVFSAMTTARSSPPSASGRSGTPLYRMVLMPSFTRKHAASLAPVKSSATMPSRMFPISDPSHLGSGSLLDDHGSQLRHIGHKEQHEDHDQPERHKFF